MADLSLDNALMMREQGLFRAMLRDMPEDEIRAGLATRKWIDFENRDQLSWREVLARSELARRESRAPDKRELIAMDAKIAEVQDELEQARTRARTATLIASATSAALVVVLLLWGATVFLA